MRSNSPTVTAEERLALIRVKIERAKEHISNLDSELRCFLDAKPYTVGSRINEEEGYTVFYMVNVTNPPQRIAAIAGDAIHNLRSALDHLAYQLVSIGTNGHGPFDNVYFPIAKSASIYRSTSARKLSGMRQEAKDWISELEPYRGGRGEPLWLLHTLDIADKHKLLVTVVSDLHSIDVQVKRKGKPDFRDYFYVRPEGTPMKRSLRTGHILYIREGEAIEELDLACEVAFSEAGIIEGKPVLLTLRQMEEFVEEVIIKSKPFLD